MTTDAKTRANRRNALRSTGPRTAEGKAQSRQNAYKHGLSISVDAADPEVEELAEVIAKLEGMFGEVRDMIRSAAREQYQLARVQQTRVKIINDQIEKPRDDEDQCVSADERIAIAVVETLPDLEALERYERRALSGLRKKLRKLQGQ